MNIRNKIGDVPSLDPGVVASSQSKVMISGEEHAFDDSSAPTLFVDVVTEAGAANGIVCIGLGHLIFPPQGKAHVAGDMHLRLSVSMAASLVETLSDALRKASEQQSTIGARRRSN